MMLTTPTTSIMKITRNITPIHISMFYHIRDHYSTPIIIPNVTGTMVMLQTFTLIIVSMMVMMMMMMMVMTSIPTTISKAIEDNCSHHY